MGLLNKFRKVTQKKSVEQEVAEHLTTLLNTKQDYGAWQKGLGLCSYSSGKDRTDIIEDMARDLKFNIETYDTRVQIVSIEVASDKNVFNPRFHINCKIGERFHSFYVGFNKPPHPIDVEVLS